MAVVLEDTQGSAMDGSGIDDERGAQVVVLERELAPGKHVPERWDPPGRASRLVG
jgi:hypothetical protein